MQKKGKQFNGTEWVKKHVEQRTQKALSEQNKLFAKAHAGDSDEELLAYVQECAWKIGGTPFPSEIIGGKYISCRLGGWYAVVSSADLHSPYERRPLKTETAYFKEYTRQEQLFHAERRKAKREKEEKRLAKRAAKLHALPTSKRTETEGYIAARCVPSSGIDVQEDRA